MDLNVLNEKVGKLCGELGCKYEEVCTVIGIKRQSLEKALAGEDENNALKIEKFFEAREYAFSIYSEEHQNILKNLEKRIIEKGSVGNALQGANIAASVISDIRKGKYNGKFDEKFREINNLLELKEEAKKVYRHDKYIPTSISEKIYENIRTAHVQGVCMMITGDAGIGKTEAAKQYVRKHPESAVIITAIEPRTNKTAALEMLAKALRIDLSETKRSAYAMKILDELNDGTVIIVDEVQNFKFEAIDTLRAFSDYFRDNNLGTVGLACMGNEIFREQFSGKSGKGKEQVWNRFAERPKYRADKIPFSDIELMFPILKQQNMIKELKLLHSIALSPKENIRSAVHLFTTMYNRGHYDFDSLVKQAKNMQIDLSNLSHIIKTISR